MLADFAPRVSGLSSTDGGDAPVYSIQPWPDHPARFGLYRDDEPLAVDDDPARVIYRLVRQVSAESLSAAHSDYLLLRAGVAATPTGDAVLLVGGPGYRLPLRARRPSGRRFSLPRAGGRRARWRGSRTAPSARRRAAAACGRRERRRRVHAPHRAARRSGPPGPDPGRGLTGAPTAKTLSRLVDLGVGRGSPRGVGYSPHLRRSPSPVSRSRPTATCS